MCQVLFSIFFESRQKRRNTNGNADKKRTESENNKSYFWFPTSVFKNEKRKNNTQYDEQDDGKRQCPNLSLFHKAPSVNDKISKSTQSKTLYWVLYNKKNGLSTDDLFFCDKNAKTKYVAKKS